MYIYSCFFFFKQKTAYEMRISDWSSDVCSSDLRAGAGRPVQARRLHRRRTVCAGRARQRAGRRHRRCPPDRKSVVEGKSVSVRVDLGGRRILKKKQTNHDEEHTMHIPATARSYLQTHNSTTTLAQNISHN